ncbi:DUF4097 family beta strand repeat-containing protein [Nonomuraea sp. NPDC050404]|uniref:DUF4097 family beta strand repeat-containing protein n=1 Tax=Nonomuraea sp. NPDC050404 TaxID=3155783 RepID=UPI0033E1B8BE
MKTIAISGGLLASALLLTGCGLDSMTGPGNEDTVSYEVSEKVTALRLETGSGDTVITETDGAAVRVVETLHWRGDNKPKPEHPVRNQTLSLAYECQSDWGSCSVNYKIEVPKGLAVDVDSGSGDLTLRDLSGSLNVQMGSGDVDSAGLAGKKVSVYAGSGNVELKYVSAPEDARVETGSGDITLRVPDDGYVVKPDTDSGDVSVKIKTDNAAPRKISLTAGSGDVAVTPA